MKLLNVRLSPDDARLVSELRREGIPIARLVREAIHTAHRTQIASREGARRPAEIMTEIYTQCPDPPHLTRRRSLPRDRRSITKMIREKLRRKRR